MTRELSFTPRTGLSRPLGGLAALVYPVVLVALAIRTGFGRDAGLDELAASFLAALFVLIAEPTAWIFSFDFIDAGRFTILFVGGLTSLPLWYLAGSALAAASNRWTDWVRRYTFVCLAWTVLNLVVFSVVAWLAG